MERTLERADTRLQKICDTLRQEALEPAKEEANRIIEQAQNEAKSIIAEAQKQAEAIIDLGRKSAEKEKNVFISSLEQASKQTIEDLKQKIETKLFNSQLDILLSKEISNPQIISELISSMIQALQKDGFSTDFSALIAKNASVDEVNHLLGKGVLEQIKGGSVEVGDFNGGAKLKLHDKKMTLDISDEALKDLFSRYLRKEFRRFLFG